MAAATPEERGRIPGIKPERGDVILAGALVVLGVMEAAGVDDLEATEAGLREGVFFETLLGDADPPLFADVRAQAVRNLAAQYHADADHTGHVAGSASRCGTRWRRPAPIAAIPRSASCCGRARCSTTSGPRSTTTTTTSTRAISSSTRISPASRHARPR
jgi:exopolyphosphatase/pppGpp-phosphohydrolase